MQDNFQYFETSNGVCIKVMVIYIGYHSVSNENYYVWAYTINIQNQRDDVVKLEKRHWEIIDSNGIISKVDGDGVVGEKPILKNNEVFEYTSGAHLSSNSGIMRGHYSFSICSDEKTEDNKDNKEDNYFKVTIPPFSLDAISDKSFSN